MRASDHREGPGEAPAVAMEHRQCPEIDAVLAHAAGKHIADREQIGAAVVIDHALGIAGSARRVVERDRVPFVVRHFPREVRIARRDEVLVFDRGEPLAGAGEFGIVVVDEQRLHLGERERLLREFPEFAVGDQYLRVGVIELEGDERRVEPGIDGVEHRAGHRHAVVAFEHRRRVGEHDRHGVAALDAAPRQRRGQLLRARVELGIVPPQIPMNDRSPVGKYRGGPLQERQRSQRLEVRGIPVEIDVVRRRHVRPARFLNCTSKLSACSGKVGTGFPLQRAGMEGGSATPFSAMTARRRLG